MKKISKVIYGIIPKYIPTRIVLLFMEILKYFGHMKETEIDKHLSVNDVLWRKYYEEKRRKVHIGKTDISNINPEKTTSKDSGKMDQKKEESDFKEVKGRKEEVFERKENKDRKTFKEEEHYKKDSEKIYIDNQNELVSFLYGKQKDKLSINFMNGEKLNASLNSCEVIAVYNALTSMGIKIDFPKLIAFFEKKGMILSGYFGTSVRSIERCLKKYNLKTKRLVGKRITKDRVERFAYKYKSFIFMSYNNKDTIEDMIHTMAVLKDEKGYKIYNDYEGNKRGDNLYRLVMDYRKGRSKPIVLIGICD